MQTAAFVRASVMTKRAQVEPGRTELVAAAVTSAGEKVSSRFGALRDFVKAKADEAAVAVAEKKKQISRDAKLKAGATRTRASTFADNLRESLRSKKAELELRRSRLQQPTVHEMTSRVLACWLPPTTSNSDRQKALEQLREALEPHRGAFIVYNLSGSTFDCALFDEQVIQDASFTHTLGVPCPPTLERALSLCAAIDAWLRADASNVVGIVGTVDGWQAPLLVAELLLFARFTTDARIALAYVAHQLDHVHYVAPPASFARHAHFAATLLHRERPPCAHALRLRFVYVHSVLPCDDDGSCRAVLEIVSGIDGALLAASVPGGLAAGSHLETVPA
jgi:hypothetical protein